MMISLGSLSKHLFLPRLFLRIFLGYFMLRFCSTVLLFINVHILVIFFTITLLIFFEANLFLVPFFFLLFFGFLFSLHVLFLNAFSLSLQFSLLLQLIHLLFDLSL